MKCRYCGSSISSSVSLGAIPLVNYFPNAREAAKQKRYPLNFAICPSCGLGQIDTIVPREDVFVNYHYATGASEPLVNELSELAAQLVKTYHLNTRSAVLDVGSNDGTLLSFFAKKNIPVIGIEPSKTLAGVALSRGVPTVCGFFSEKTAGSLVKKYGQFDLVCATHVLANIPDIKDFFKGISTVLKTDGIALIEVADMDIMLKTGQFDAIYHEHYSYFSGKTISEIARDAGFIVVDFSRPDTQGGSIRIHLKKQVSGVKQKAIRQKTSKITTAAFGKKVTQYTRDFAELLAQNKGKIIAGYGAPAKAVTLLHACNISKDAISYIVDTTVQKQGRLLPGILIPIVDDSELSKNPPDVIILFAWNYADAILVKLKRLLKKPTLCIIPFPKLKIIRLK